MTIMQATTRIQVGANVVPQAKTPSVNILLGDGKAQTLQIPKSHDEMMGLLAQRRQLNEQLDQATDRRNDLMNKILGAPETAKPGLQGELNVLNDRIVQLESNLNVIGQEIAGASPELISMAEEPSTRPGDAFGEGVEPDVAASVRSGVDRLADLGAKVGEATLPHAGYALSAYYLIAPSEASSNLARFDAMRYGLRVGDDGTRDAEEVMALTREQGFGAEVKRRIILGAYALSSGYYDAYYGKAQQVRTLIIRDFDAAFGQVDVLVSPATPTTAFRIGERVDDPMAMYLADLATIPSDLAGNAAISVPCGLADEDGLPVGLQVMAPAMADDRLYRVAAAAEAAFTARWGHPLLAEAKGL